MATLFPVGPERGPAPLDVARRYIAECRAKLHPDPFPEITERARVDQALRTTKAVR